MKFILIPSLFLSSIISVRAQSGAWGQCGGINWTGATTCVSGYVCSYLNDYYSQCIPGTAATTTTRTTTSVTSATRNTTSISTSTSTSTSSSGTVGPSTTVSGAAPTGTQIRAVQDPVFHLYVQSSGGAAVLGPESSSGYFTISGSIALNSASGSKTYLNIANSTTSYKALSFGTSATFTGWGLEGDTIITTTASSYGRQLNFLACTTSTSGIYSLYLQIGNDVPSGATCTLISLHLPCLC